MTESHSPAVDPRQPFAAGLPVTESMIHRLVHAFYAKVREDPVLGPIFGRVIAEEDWPAHLAKLCDFWSAVTLRTGRFRGSPMQAHLQVGGIQPAHSPAGCNCSMRLPGRSARPRRRPCSSTGRG